MQCLSRQIHRSCCRSRHIQTCAVAVSAAPDTLEAGCIVEFKTETRQELALLQRPNGKTNWFGTDVRYIEHACSTLCHSITSHVMMLFVCLTGVLHMYAMKAGTSKSVCTCRGQTYSLQPKQMVYMLPGSDYKEADLQQIHEEALKEADVTLLADAWEVSSYVSTWYNLSCHPATNILSHCLHIWVSLHLIDKLKKLDILISS